MKKKFIELMPSKKEIFRLQALVKSFDEIAHIAAPIDPKSIVECSEGIDKIQNVLKKFGREYGL